jgi:integrase
MYVDEDRVFCKVDGTALVPRVVSRRFAALVKQAGLPKLTMHGLRHTWATLAMAAGVPAKVVQEHLGHTNVSITLQLYSHVSPGMDRDAVDLVASMFRRQT